MEGYSVTEAASILGVPTERVWELLARGVLSGAPEGDTGMRVYLQPRPAPAPPVAAAGRPNGDTNQAEQRELSPFRELLTEFRNLTERYGQALLALGEARGEVAALRSRVDLLEARMDLRLPMAPGGVTDPGWGAGQMEPAATPAPAPAGGDARPDREPPPPSPHAEGAEALGDEHDRPSGRRRSSQRRATEAFAEALARADDPTRPELPGAAETAAAMAALRDQGAAEAQEPRAEAVLPRELPAADSIPSADEVPATPTPAARAEGEPGPADRPEADAQPDDPMRRQAPALEPVAAEPFADAEEPEEPEGEADDAAAEGAQVPVIEPAPAGPEEAAVAPPIAWDPDRYTVAIQEPDWIAGEVADDDESRQQPIAPPAADADREKPAAGVEPEPEPEDEPEAETDAAPERTPQPDEDAADAAQPAPEAAAGDPATVSAAEETMLWFGPGGREPGAAAATDHGADEMEVAGGGTAGEGRPMPGARELDDALAALDALARGGEPHAPSESEPTPPPDPETAVGPVAPSRAPAWPVTDAPSARPAEPWVRADPAPGPAPDRASVTPASRAYRRLRRIFPG